jgi:hypothetical protein
MNVIGHDDRRMDKRGPSMLIENLGEHDVANG